MKKAILVAIIGALTVSVNAGGSWGGKAPVQDKVPLPDPCVDVGGNLSAGYATDFLLHGLRINRDTVWLDASYTFDSIAPVTLGVSHINGIDDYVLGRASLLPFLFPNGTDITNVYAKVALPEIAGFAASIGYTHRFFRFPTFSPVANGSWGDVSLSLRRDIGFADLVIGSTLGINVAGLGDGWVHTAGLEKGISLTDSLDLVLSGGVGYHDGYYNIPGSAAPFGAIGTGTGSGWSHYYLNAALPIALGSHATLTPYVGYNGVQQWNQYNHQGDLLHAGISLSVDF